MKGKNKSTIGVKGAIIDANIKAAVASAQSENYLGNSDHNMYVSGEGQYIYANAEANNGFYLGEDDKIGFIAGGAAEAGGAKGEVSYGITTFGYKLGFTEGACFQCGGVSYRLGAIYDMKKGEVTVQGFGSVGLDVGAKLGGNVTVPLKWLKIIDKIKHKE
ncbi:hypothetical protein [Chryseobacterium sp. SORGH_AS_1048]|uniref:hypothetical protein n=1 Tax=Chryseobacterium sp. SORGH_AS_1048 TaxID=3041783 RepID=UPI002784B4C6|nr:hypothetical protein [Chryseobacterium sp. SORGH_AS_1048]MDQ1101463.1 hypothetical protein [Chryseobacterium sp. SORGH_AS_1048]